MFIRNVDPARQQIHVVHGKVAWVNYLIVGIALSELTIVAFGITDSNAALGYRENVRPFAASDALLDLDYDAEAARLPFDGDCTQPLHSAVPIALVPRKAHAASSSIIALMRSVTCFRSASISARGRGGSKT